MTNSVPLIDKGAGVMGSRRTVSLHRQISENPYASPFFKFAKTELFTSRFLCLVEEMGAQLERTALSVNVRERLDFSCALLTSPAAWWRMRHTYRSILGPWDCACEKCFEKPFPWKRGILMISNHPRVRRLASARRNRDVAGVR